MNSSVTRKRVRVNSDLNDIFEFEPQASIIDISIIDNYFSQIKKFNENELIVSCIKKFNDQIQNIINNVEINQSFNKNIEKLQFKSINKSIKNCEDLNIYIDESYLDLIYDSCTKFVNYQLTYILHELSKIRKKIKNNQIYYDKMSKLNKCIKVLLYYIFTKSIHEVEKEEEALLNSYNI